jgi:hypothetical protein
VLSTGAVAALCSASLFSSRRLSCAKDAFPLRATLRAQEGPDEIWQRGRDRFDPRGVSCETWAPPALWTGQRAPTEWVLVIHLLPRRGAGGNLLKRHVRQGEDGRGSRLRRCPTPKSNTSEESGRSQSVAIVTGSSSGIGRATAIRLSRDFSAVVLAARRAAEFGETE